MSRFPSQIPVLNVDLEQKSAIAFSTSGEALVAGTQEFAEFMDSDDSQIFLVDLVSDWELTLFLLRKLI